MVGGASGRSDGRAGAADRESPPGPTSSGGPYTGGYWLMTVGGPPGSFPGAAPTTRL
jgi:hypothetical protein